MKIFFSLICLLLSILNSSGAYAGDCDSIIRGGKVFKHNVTHKKGYSWTGKITIDDAYSCDSGICFTGTITFSGTSQFNSIKGTASGDSISFIRYWSNNKRQKYTGQCSSSGYMRGEFYDNGSFAGNFNAR